MDNGELDFSNQEMFSCPDLGDLPNMDNLFDEILNDTHTCTHTHSCNPPGPDLPHTHTCFHLHTQILSPPNECSDSPDNIMESADKKSKKLPSGNREAVRKYREKKKAHTASLEDEVERLRALNQQLMKRLQGQEALKAEIARLKHLLVDVRGRIDGGIGSFPYQNMATKNFPGAYVLMNPCSNIQCNDQVYCHRPGVVERSGEVEALNGQRFSGCESENLQCLADQNAGLKGFPGCGLGLLSPRG